MQILDRDVYESQADPMQINSQVILGFWFHELSPRDWWKKSQSLDESIKKRFGNIHWACSHGEFYHWRQNPQGRLAEVIILDQFSRNIYRECSRSFAFDGMALALAQEAVAAGNDKELPTEKRAFFYMPYMHSESPKIHEIAVQLFSQTGLEGSLEFELRHKAIIDRFGRYPHRNQILGRESTPEEIRFLAEPGSRF